MCSIVNISSTSAMLNMSLGWPMNETTTTKGRTTISPIAANWPVARRKSAAKPTYISSVHYYFLYLPSQFRERKKLRKTHLWHQCQKLEAHQREPVMQPNKLGCLQQALEEHSMGHLIRDSRLPERASKPTKCYDKGDEHSQNVTIKFVAEMLSIG